MINLLLNGGNKLKDVNRSSDYIFENEVIKEDTIVKYNLDTITFEEDFDGYLMNNIIIDRNKGYDIANAVGQMHNSGIKDNSIIDNMRDRLSTVTSRKVDGDISRDCIDAFSRKLHCKSWIVDDCLIDFGINILEHMLEKSGYNTYIDFYNEIRKIVKSNIIVSVGFGSINNSLGSAHRTFNVKDSTKAKLDVLCVNIGCNKSELVYICCMLSLCFSKSLIDDVGWFKRSYILNENDFIIKKIFKSFITQKSNYKRSCMPLIESMHLLYKSNIYEITLKYDFNNLDMDNINDFDIHLIKETVILYKSLRKADKFRMLDSKIKYNLSINVKLITQIKAFLKKLNK